jgi:hypothetical protein
MCERTLRDRGRAQCSHPKQGDCMRRMCSSPPETFWRSVMASGVWIEESTVGKWLSRSPKPHFWHLGS